MTAFTGSSTLSSVTNYSYYAVPAAWLVAFVPHAYAAAISKGQFKNSSPRQMLHDLMAKKAKTPLDQKIVRAEAAQLNGFENLALFATAVVAANAAGVPAHQLNQLTGGYLISRILYNLLYINIDTEQFAAIRSATFISGVGMIFTLFIKAANRAL